jgi:hypothetical protein
LEVLDDLLGGLTYKAEVSEEPSRSAEAMEEMRGLGDGAE